MDFADPRYPGNDPRYRNLAKQQLPLAECLKDTVGRVLPCWDELIVPVIHSGQLVLIVAHGNTLRALVKQLENLSETQIVEVEIPTGVPRVEELDDDLRSIRHCYLGEASHIENAMGTRSSVGSMK